MSTFKRQTKYQIRGSWICWFPTSHVSYWRLGSHIFNGACYDHYPSCNFPWFSGQSHLQDNFLFTIPVQPSYISMFRGRGKPSNLYIHEPFWTNSYNEMLQIQQVMVSTSESGTKTLRSQPKPKMVTSFFLGLLETKVVCKIVKSKVFIGFLTIYLQ